MNSTVCVDRVSLSSDFMHLIKWNELLIFRFLIFPQARNIWLNGIGLRAKTMKIRQQIKLLGSVFFHFIQSWNWTRNVWFTVFIRCINFCCYFTKIIRSFFISISIFSFYIFIRFTVAVTNQNPGRTLRSVHDEHYQRHIVRQVWCSQFK